MKRLLPILLTLALTLSLTACGGGSDPAPTATAAPTPPAVDQTTAAALLPDNATDVVQTLLGYPEETVLLTVNGVAVTAEEYCYWLGNLTSYYEMMYGMYGTQGELDLTAEVTEGVTWDEQLRSIARENCVLLAIAPALAQEMNVALDADDLADLASEREQNIQECGGDERYAYQLQAMGVNDATATQMDRTARLFSKAQSAYLAQSAAALAGEEVSAYVAEHDLLRAKHILLLTKDMTTGERYDDATVAAQRATADSLLALLRDDPSEDNFDRLMQEHSEDTGLSAYPDGYLFSAGEMVSEFEQGTRALAVGGISEVIESDYGYHIILRLDPDCDEVRQTIAQGACDDWLDAHIAQADITLTAEYQAITTADYYAALTAFQEALPVPAQTEDVSDATLQPDLADAG